MACWTMKKTAYLCALATSCGQAALASAAGPANFIMQARIADRVIEGRPVSWDDDHMLLLGRDGALHEFHPADAEDAKKTGTRFVGYSPNEMRARLRADYDEQFDISVTEHFVVVHPSDSGEWANRLEGLYRSFIHYMSVRGFSPRHPSTPLTAVVFRD